MAKRIIEFPRHQQRRPSASVLLLMGAAVALGACGAAESRTSPTLPTRPAASASVSQANPLLDYQLSIEKVNRLYLAHHALYRLSRKDPAPLERLQETVNEIAPEAVNLLVDATDREPAVREAFAQVGISPRDFFITQYNLVNAVTVLEARAKGRTDNLPEVSEANIEFVRLNPQLLQRVMTGRRPSAP